MIPVLKISQVKQSFANNSVLSGVDFSVLQGETVALIGNNGSGKSTLLRIAAGLQKPSHGHCTIHGTNVLQISGSERAQKISWVSAHQTEASGFFAIQFVALAEELKRFSQGRYSPSEAEYARYLSGLRLFDSEHLANHSLNKLSTGEWKRVQLARAWINKAPVLLLDEPSNGLDVQHTSMLAKRIREYAINNRAAVLFSSHDFEFVSAIADRIIILHNGVAAFNGTPGSIQQFELEKIFGVPFAAGMRPVYSAK